jgi:hypothetical protein
LTGCVARQIVGVACRFRGQQLRLAKTRAAKRRNGTL